MLRNAAAGAMIAIGAWLPPAIASADELTLFNSEGAAMKVDTTKIDACKVVFDSAGSAFEFCKLERVEMRPPNSTRMRPGQTAARERANVIYAKSSDREE